jgi:hypothetical protein
MKIKQGKYWLIGGVKVPQFLAIEMIFNAVLLNKSDC